MEVVPLAAWTFDVQSGLSAVLDASWKCSQKFLLKDGMKEMAWRHDHDRLFFEFFLRQPEMAQGNQESNSQDELVLDGELVSVYARCVQSIRDSTTT